MNSEQLWAKYLGSEKTPIVKIDFDDTIRIFRSGELIENAILAIKLLRYHGCELILDTCRADEDLEDAKNFLAQYGILECFSQFNENSDKIPEKFKNLSKIYCNYGIDDKNIGGLKPWNESFHIIYKDWLRHNS